MGRVGLVGGVGVGYMDRVGLVDGVGVGYMDGVGHGVRI